MVIPINAYVTVSYSDGDLKRRQFTCGIGIMRLIFVYFCQRCVCRFWYEVL